MATYIGSNQISDAESDLAGMMHGTTINQIQNLEGLWNRAARRVLTDVDLWETKVIYEIGQVFDEVYDYTPPVDLKGNKIIDIYPQYTRNLRDSFSQVYNKDFDLWKQYTLMPQTTLITNAGQRTLRINATQLNTGIPVNVISSVTSDGTWATGGNASSIATDNIYYVGDAASSVSFNLNATGIAGSTGYIENSTMNAIDLTNHLNQGTEFLYLYFPTASSITSVELRWGSSSTAYWSQTATLQTTGNAFINGWNLISFPWKTATQVGSPTVTSIKYARITITYDGTLQTAVRANELISRLGVILMLEYYSKYLFRDSTSNAMKEKTTSSNDYIQLDTDAYDLFLYAAAIDATQQMQGVEALFFDSNEFKDRYDTALAAYQGKYKSEITKPKTQGYRMPQSSKRKYFGNRYGRS